MDERPRIYLVLLYQISLDVSLEMGITAGPSRNTTMDLKLMYTNRTVVVGSFLVDVKPLLPHFFHRDPVAKHLAH